MKAFASGSVALTGTEAIANGVPAFKPPEAKNAANTLVVMAVLLAILFIGITVVADAYQIVPSEEGSGGPTVIALVATAAFGAGSPLFYVFQISTALILFLAANTSYNAFPRLAALLAADNYMPRQFSFRGDRLAFSWGIILLSVVAAMLLVYFGGITTLLIPLYSVGVFVCFTLSQTGMVLHWRRHPEPGWRRRAAINALGAVLTAVVLAIVVFEKFAGGAYLVVILIPVLVGMMLFINRQYTASARELAVRPDFVVAPPIREERSIVPVPTLNRAVVRAVNVARSISEEVTAVYISDDPDNAAEMRERWERQVPGVPLIIVESPYRALAGPLVAYLDVLDLAWPPGKPDPITFVVIPEYVARSWWERILYNQSARRLRTVLLGRPQHRRRQRAVPPRRPDPVRHGRRRDRRHDGRHVGDARGVRRRPAPGRGRPRRPARTSTPTPATEPGRRRPVGPPTLSRARSVVSWRRAAARAGRDPIARSGPPRTRRLQRPWPTRRHHSSGAPSWRCPVPGPTGPSSRSPPSSPVRPRPSWSASTSSRSTGRCRSTPTSRAGRRTRSASWTSPRPRPRRATTRSRRSCSRRATSGRRSSTRRPSVAPTSSSAACRSVAASAATSRSAAPSPTY